MPPPILASDALRKCGNPSCAKPGNVKDATLARCSACRVIAYCSGECQRGHWKLHKTVCKETTKRLQTVTELMVAHCHNCKSPHVPTKQCNVCLHNFCKQPDCGPAHLPCDKPVSYEPIKYKYVY